MHFNLERLRQVVVLVEDSTDIMSLKIKPVHLTTVFRSSIFGKNELKIPASRWMLEFGVLLVPFPLFAGSFASFVLA